jgi:dipeptidase E
MKFYLSSYGIGNEVKKLKKMIPKGNKKTAYISNALDYSKGLERRKKHEKRNIKQLTKVGLDVEILDLRNYFNKSYRLKEKLKEFGVIWVSGGNTFVLRQAMKLSGFDVILKSLLKKDNILYGGYSAGICVLTPTLRGLELVDDPSAKPYGRKSKVIWDGLGILSYSIAPHYKSDHPESKRMNKVVEYMIDNKMLFKTLRDGEVIIIE